MTQEAASLHALLRRTHLGFALGAVALVGVVLAGTGLATLHVYAEHDLRLTGRAIGYTLEAAVVFGDKDAAGSELHSIAQTEDILAVSVTVQDGTVLARWDAPGEGWRAAFGRVLGGLLFDGPARVPILHDGSAIGQVEIWGGARTLQPFLFYGALGVLLCQIAAVAGAIHLSGRIQRRIVLPLRKLAEITATVQRDRAFGRRVPRGDIEELNELGDTFNLLLAELDAWHVGITGENARLSYEATHDGLTGLWNRSHFKARLDRAMVESHAAGLAVMLLDCNGFKQVNDTHGHAAGDMVLMAIAARLREHLRKDDLVARIGGDEFAILLAPCPPRGTLDGLVATLYDAIRMPIGIMASEAVTVGVSIGLASYPEDATNRQTLLHNADLAMYKDKQTRRR